MVLGTYVNLYEADSKAASKPETNILLPPPILDQSPEVVKEPELVIREPEIQGKSAREKPPDENGNQTIVNIIGILFFRKFKRRGKLLHYSYFGSFWKQLHSYFFWFHFYCTTFFSTFTVLFFKYFKGIFQLSRSFLCCFAKTIFCI